MKRLSDLLQYLDMQAETCGLSTVDIDIMLETKKMFNELIREDNIKFFSKG
jgi:hypothetical protein